MVRSEQHEEDREKDSVADLEEAPVTIYPYLGEKNSVADLEEAPSLYTPTKERRTAWQTSGGPVTIYGSYTHNRAHEADVRGA